MIINRSNSARQLQVRKPRRDGWTTAKRKVFLDTLAATCNVATAAGAAGMSVHGVRALRRRDGEFARLWAEALAQGVELLEEMLLAHALGQVPTGDNPVGDRELPPSLPPFDHKKALDTLKYLQLQQPRAQSRARKLTTAPTQAEVDELLTKRLDALARRMGNQA